MFCFSIFPFSSYRTWSFIFFLFLYFITFLSVSNLNIYDSLCAGRLKRWLVMVGTMLIWSRVQSVGPGDSVHHNGAPAPLVEGVGVSSVIRARPGGSLRGTQGREGLFCVCLLFHFLGDQVDTDLLPLLLQVGEIPTQDGYVFQVHRAGSWLAETQSFQLLVTPWVSLLQDWRGTAHLDSGVPLWDLLVWRQAARSNLSKTRRTLEAWMGAREALT